MKQKTFILQSEQIADNLREFCLLKMESGLQIEAVVREHNSDRSLAQNALMWVWITHIAGEHGLSKDEVHEDFKRRLLVPIYERDDKGYAAMIQAVRNVHTQGMKQDAEAMAKQIVKLTTTTTATVEQFTEYLNEIEIDSRNKGIFLPHPEDMYREAIKQ